MEKEACLKTPSFWERLIRLLYPVKCMVCDTLLKEDSPLYFCEACYKTIPRFEKGFVKNPALPYINGMTAAFYYEGGIDKAIHAMKFNHQPKLSATMGYLLYEQIKRESVVPEFDIIVPVPMHPRKRRRRGYNQAELVAKELSTYLGVPVCADLLYKTRMTHPQSRLKREERLHNMEGAFSIHDHNELTGKIILLVDDVVTTGTTLNSCAKILYEKGASWIFASVIAIAEK